MAQANGEQFSQRFLASLAGTIRHRPRLLIVAIVVIFGVLEVASMREKSLTFDELFHVTGGYTYWKTNDYRIHATNGNLTQRWEALPLLAVGPRLPSTDRPEWYHPDYFGLQYGKEFFFRSGNNPVPLVWLPRLMTLVLGLLLALLVYKWSKDLYGRLGGFISLVLYAFSPNILAHAHLATSDVPATFGFTLALYCLWRLLHHLTWGRLAASCLAMAAASLLKFSCPLLAPVGLVMAAARVARGKPLPVGSKNHRREVQGRLRISLVMLFLVVVHLAVVWGAIWSAYGFRYSTFAEFESGRDEFDDEWSWVLDMRNKPAVEVIRFAQRHKLLPEAFLYGLGHTVHSSTEGRPSYLLGEVHERGTWYYHPYCYLIKSTLPALLLIAGMILTYLVRWTRAPARRRWSVIRTDLYRTIPLTSLLVVYWSTSLSTALNLGVRHLLPVLPATFILCGVLSQWFRRTSGNSQKCLHPRLALAICLLLTWHVAEAVRGFPDYISYFNQTVRPSQAYKYVVDSNLDWGQELPALAKWIATRRTLDVTRQPIYFFYVGTDSPERFDVDAINFFDHLRINISPRPFEPGIFCISTYAIYGGTVPRWNDESEQTYRWLLEQLGSQQTIAEAGGFESATVQGWCDELGRLQMLRFMAYLRAREPEDTIKQAFQVFYFNERDLHAALHLPLRSS